MMLKTHRSPEGGLHFSLRDPIRQSYHERQLGAFEQQFHVRLLRQGRHVSVLPAPAKHTAMMEAALFEPLRRCMGAYVERRFFRRSD
jgi:hypothetical protein